MRIRNAVVLFSSVLNLAATARADCTDDIACGPGMRCSGGICVNLGEAPAATVASTAENTAQTCRDGSDNDRDSYVDCADQDCMPFKFCTGDVGVAPQHADLKLSATSLMDTGTTRGIPALYITGPIILGVVYIITIAVTAAVSEEPDVGRSTTYAAIPVAGPWAMLASSIDTSDYVGPLAASGVLQASGLIMLIAGLAIRRPVYRGATARYGATIEPFAVNRSGLGLRVQWHNL